MAKAVAICRCATCGKEFELSAVKQNRREADKWEEWAVSYYDECAECYQKRKERQREEENQKAAEMATEAGLPKLTGSEKQVAWAESIRMGFYQVTAAEMERAQEKFARTKDERKERWRKRLEGMTEFRNWIFSHDDARFWIDHRGTFTTIDGGLLTAELNLSDLYAQENVPEDVKEELESEIVTLEPESKKHTTVCEVNFTDKVVTAMSDYDPDMPPVVKANGFRWRDGIWQKAIDETTGSAADRAVEVANKLLLAGFPVRVNRAIADKVTTGDYVPEHRRWIIYDVEKGELALKTEPGADELINKARMITGSPKYGWVLIPISSWEEVLEFAQVHDFRISRAAQHSIDTFRSMVIKTPVKPGQEIEYKETDTKAILDSSRDVLDDLKEED